jgi:hypothetical protein
MHPSFMIRTEDNSINSHGFTVENNINIPESFAGEANSDRQVLIEHKDNSRGSHNKIIKKSFNVIVNQESDNMTLVNDNGNTGDVDYRHFSESFNRFNFPGGNNNSVRYTPYPNRNYQRPFKKLLDVEDIKEMFTNNNNNSYLTKESPASPSYSMIQRSRQYGIIQNGDYFHQKHCTFLKD